MDKSGRISDATMMWKKDYQERFLEIIRTYGDTIEACFAGHTHMDAYRITVQQSGETTETVLLTPSLSSRYGNNPAFRVFTLSTANWELLDYRSVAFPFETSDPEFETYYVFSTAYDHEPLLEPALTQLLPELVTDEAQRRKYTRFDYSGHDAGNPINDTNWPAYWCAIRSMSKAGCIECVNSYR